MTEETTKPAETTMVTAPVGLLNIYEYTMNYSEIDNSNSYLNNYLNSWLITPYNATRNWSVAGGGYTSQVACAGTRGIRPAVNLKPNVKIVDGDGTVDNPYRLDGDNDTNLYGTLLNTRYSGEYVTFRTGENDLYRIVSHETVGLTKITSAKPLKKSGDFLTLSFDDSVNFSSSNTIGRFLNEDYSNTENGYLTSNDVAMIEDNTTWYLGTVERGYNYKLAKYTDTTDNILTSSVAIAKVGLLRYGELMAGQFSSNNNNIGYWLLTPFSTTDIWQIHEESYGLQTIPSEQYAIKPSLNLKQNVIITGGDGTLQNPFTLSVN